MITIDKSGCKPFANEQQINSYMDKALKGFDTLESGSGAGNDCHDDDADCGAPGEEERHAYAEEDCGCSVKRPASHSGFAAIGLLLLGCITSLRRRRAKDARP